jgi:hypothetical protein
MSPLGTKSKVAIWVAVIGAVGATVAAIAPGIIARISGDGSKHISGVVSDAQTKASLPGAVVQLLTNEGQYLARDTTDQGGNFSLTIPRGPSVVRVSLNVNGYVPYDEKLAAQDAKDDIHLVRQHIQFGIPDGAKLNSATQIIADKLNVTVVFSKTCGQKAVSATLNGGQLEGDPRVPDAILRDLTQRVKDNTLRYDITTIEAEKRYEVRCF